MRYARFLSVILILALALSLGGCTQPHSESAPTVRQPTTIPLPAAESEASTEPTALEVDDDYQVRQMPEEITIYPFTSGEMEEALAVVEEVLAGFAQEPGTLTYEVERVAYDPIMTDVHIRQEIANAPLAGWSEDDYYINRISFVITYSAEYDHSATFLPDAIHEKFSMKLRRESADSPWEYHSHGVPVEEFFDKCLTAQELSYLPAEETILAGYLKQGQDYWLYLYDEATGEVRLEWFGRGTLIPEEVWDESTLQIGEAISPQPGDTSSTWNPDLAASYPADEDCGDMELLEKWMAVEGVTWADIEERQCTQLILVCAQEDGVSTITTCYERQDGGTWAAAEGLTRMSGWVGSGGVMHNRQRNTNTSPAGLWSLGLAFGNEEEPEGLHIPWRDITSNSEWVCDANSIYFNTWQERNDPTLEETWNDDVEHLEDYQTQYAYACVIRYNTPPYTIPSRGCAIFLHCSTGSTGGCVGLPREDMVNTLLWLNEGRHPYVLITGQTVD